MTHLGSGICSAGTDFLRHRLQVSKPRLISGGNRALVCDLHRQVGCDEQT